MILRLMIKKLFICSREKKNDDKKIHCYKKQKENDRRIKLFNILYIQQLLFSFAHLLSLFLLFSSSSSIIYNRSSLFYSPIYTERATRARDTQDTPKIVSRAGDITDLPRAFAYSLFIYIYIYTHTYIYIYICACVCEPCLPSRGRVRRACPKNLHYIFFLSF